VNINLHANDEIKETRCEFDDEETRWVQNQYTGELKPEHAEASKNAVDN